MLFILNRVKEDRNLSSVIYGKIFQSVNSQLGYVGLVLFIQPYQDISSHAIAEEYECSIVLLIVSNGILAC
jgi:hypothetical protein